MSNIKDPLRPLARKIKETMPEHEEEPVSKPLYSDLTVTPSHQEARGNKVAPQTESRRSPMEEATMTHLVYGREGAIGSGSAQTQISLMRDPRLQHQHGMMMNEIGRVQGNQHVQRLVADINRQKTGRVSQPFSPSLDMTTGLDILGAEGFGFSGSKGFTPTPPSEGNAKTVQTKLTVNAPNDPYEQEADAVANQVMRMEEDEVAPTALSQNGQVQREATAPNTPPVTPEIESSISSMSGRGQALPESERNFLEPRMGYDFSQVRIHTDNQAAETSNALQARAFTVGQDVAFAPGEYQPGTDAGRQLLAHELTHVVQQGGAVAVQRKTDADPNATAPGQAETHDDAATPQPIPPRIKSALEQQFGVNLDGATVTGNVAQVRSIQDVKALSLTVNDETFNGSDYDLGSAAGRQQLANDIKGGQGTETDTDTASGDNSPATEEGKKVKAGQAVGSHVESEIKTMQGQGQALPSQVVSEIEQQMGYNFSQVRIHTHAQAAETAQNLEAKAFTLGKDIVFNADQYDPHSPEGRQLLVHELAHVAQQGGGRRIESAKGEDTPPNHEAETSTPKKPEPQPVKVASPQTDTSPTTEAKSSPVNEADRVLDRFTPEPPPALPVTDLADKSPETTAAQVMGEAPNLMAEADPITEQLTALQEASPLKIQAGLSQVKASLPARQAQQQAQIKAALPSEVPSTLEIPTLAEATGESNPVPPQERAEQAMKGMPETPSEIPQVAPPPAETEVVQANQKAQAQFSEQSEKATQEGEKAERAENPDKAKTSSAVSTSAGPRPQVPLTGAADPVQIGQQQQAADQQVGQQFAQAQTLMQADMGENALFPTEAGETVSLAEGMDEADPIAEVGEETNEAAEALAEQQAELEEQKGQVETKLETLDEEGEAHEAEEQELMHQQTEVQAEQEPLKLQAHQATKEAQKVAQQEREVKAQSESIGAMIEQAEAQRAGEAQIGQLQAQQQMMGLQLAQAIQQVSQMGQGVAMQQQQQAMQSQSLGQAEQKLAQQQAKNEAQQSGYGDMFTELEEMLAELENPEAATPSGENSEGDSEAKGQVAELLAEHQQAQTEYQGQLETAWQEGQAQIADHVAENQAQLAQIQSETQTQVADMKAEFQAKNQAMLADYQQETSQIKTQAEQDISEKKQAGEQKAHQIMSEAESKAQATKSQAETQAKNRLNQGRQEAQGKLGGVGLSMDGSYEAKAATGSETIMRQTTTDDEAKRKAAEDAAKKAAEEALKKAAEAALKLLAEMEKKVQEMIEAAKRGALAEVEAARQAIEQMVTTYGNTLNEAVAHTLGQHPEEIARYQSGVSGVVTGIMQNVNALAGALSDPTQGSWLANQPHLNEAMFGVQYQQVMYGIGAVQSAAQRNAILNAPPGTPPVPMVGRGWLPNVYFKGVGGQGVYATGGFDRVYDFTTNQIGDFSSSGWTAGTDMLSLGGNYHIGFGQKSPTLAGHFLDINEAFSGGSGSVGVAGGLGDILTGGIDIGAGGTGWANGMTNVLNDADSLRTITFSLSAGVPVPIGPQAALAALPAQVHGGFSQYTPMGNTTNYQNDAEMAQAIMSDPLLDPTEKLTLIGMAYATDEKTIPQPQTQNHTPPEPDRRVTPTPEAQETPTPECNNNQKPEEPKIAPNPTPNKDTKGGTSQKNSPPNTVQPQPKPNPTPPPQP